MATIVTVYAGARDPWELRDMGHIRWLKISAALARLGHAVDIATNEPRWARDRTPVTMAPRLRRVPLEGLDWRSYRVVKTLFHHGFETLQRYGGARHPFLIAKLGSVVAGQDRPGIYFYGAIRESLFRTQVEIHRKARYVTLLSAPARELWREVHGERPGILLIPGGVDAELPPANANPFSTPVCIFSGNIYDSKSQPEANRVLTRKLNRLGERLDGSGIRLVFQGPGDAGSLDSRWVDNLGSCTYEDSWNYLRHATVGVVVSAGPFMHNNESTKIYHYLRAGVPVVSEEGFPNDYVVRESGLGFVVASEDMDRLAAKVIEAAGASWDRAAGIRYILENHTWDHRASIYAPLIPRDRLNPLYRWFGHASFRFRWNAAASAKGPLR